MGLKERKKLSNQLPAFDGGKNYWDNMYVPYGYNQWAKQEPQTNYLTPGINYPETPLDSTDPVTQFNLRSMNPQLLTGLGRDAYSTFDTRNITQPVINTALDPESKINKDGIANINTKPTRNTNNSATGLKAASVIGGTANIVGGYIAQQSAVKSSDELLANAGTSQGNVMGVGYQQQNDINANREMDAIEKSGISNTLGSVATGASAGAAFGPIGAAVGGFVGGVAGLIGLGTSKHKLRKRIENARLMAQRRNTYNMSGAMTTGLQQDYYTNNASGGLLYANKGKDI